MKLELKHLAPYLPFELEVQVSRWSYTFGQTQTHNIVLNTEIIRLFQENYYNSVLPILVPLKELEYYSNGIKHLGYRTDKNNYLNLISDIICKRAGYDLMEMCFKEHIDVFCLIEKGLAIDKNTLSK